MFAPLRSERLTIRSVEPGDLDALVARRNDPETAKFQSWTLPFTEEDAQRMLTGSAAMSGPQDGTWWMATVVRTDDGEIVGDLAVHITWGGRSAEIGYNLGTQHRGSGYASEATDELIRYLFEDFGATRISAMMHPENLASMMVAERAGMLYEGRTKLSYWVGEGDDAENTDDVLYGLVREDWEQWRQRPTGPPDAVTLVDVTSENHRAVGALRTHKSQEHFVAPVEATFADALFPTKTEAGELRTPILLAIEADGELAGAVALIAPAAPDFEPYLWRLVIDRAHQRRGIGRLALDQLEASLKADGNRSLRVSWATGKGSPEPFYLGRGFEPTGRIEHGEVEGRKIL